MLYKKSESPKVRATTSVLMASLIVMSTMAAATSIIMISSTQSAYALNTEGKDTRCLPRSEFNGRDNAGNEHFNADGSFDQSGNPHDPGTPRGNPHDRCVGS
jgi:hypothetical protein